MHAGVGPGGVTVGILGPLEVAVDGAAIEVGGARLRVLLTRLALGVGRVVTVEELGDALWPDEKPADQTNAVRSLMTRLRRVLPDGSVLTSTSGGYRLDLPPDAVDATRFDRLAREGRRALHSGDPATAARLLTDALGLWRGPALADAPFATAHVARLEEARLTAIEDHAEAELASGQALGDYGRLVAELSEFAARHPLRERLHALLLKALYADGRQAEALAAYEDIRRRLADELGADPGPELRETHLAMLRADPSLRPDGPATRRRTTVSNLRAALTSFIGREEEVRRVGEALEQARLVTLVGPGGAGKTRLATTVATVAVETSERFPGGVWLVELAGVTDPEDVPQAVLRVLGTRGVDSRKPQTDQRDTMSRLVEALSHAQTVIVLDNCEHLVEAAAWLADDLLGRCPHLRILATSREPLNVFGETLCPVPPLEVPGRDASARDARTSPAVRLFADRAAAVRPGFEVTDDNADVTIEICRRLDGLPLAIELATARLRSLTPARLAERLDDRFRLLTGGSRTALPRHQTLRAVVAWSWGLLDSKEREFAEAVAVFPAGITVEAAEWLGGSLDLLAALVDKSLLQMVEADEPRYRMLETIREYGLERLAETGRIAKVRAAHAAYFLELAETAEPHLRSGAQLPWIARLHTERDNMLAALRFAADSGDAETAIRLASTLSIFWMLKGAHTEATGWLRLALDVPGQAPEVPRTIVSAMYLISKAFSVGLARPAGLLEALADVISAANSVPDHPVLPLVEPILRFFTDDSALALSAINRRLSHPDPWTRAMLWMMRALIRENDGDLAGMREDQAVAIAGLREVGDRSGLSSALSTLAETHMVFGDLDLAVEALEEAIRLSRELDAADDAAHERILLACTRAARGEVEAARAELETISELTGREWSARNMAFARLALGDMARYEGNLEEAARQYGAASTIIEDASFVAPQFRALILCGPAHLALDLGDIASARHEIALATAHAIEAQDMPILARATIAAAALRARLGEAWAAAELLGAAEQLRGAPDRFNMDIIRLAERLRRELGDSTYDTAYSRGRDLNRDDALALVNEGVTPAESTGNQMGNQARR